ncbi:MAG: hypothetical protein COA45_08015 [Zetaproteobacteria bacterium]|nr:MAG: hypothetical protein COA45_08015 [Zetaproteobacteria bacterium]
MLWWYFVEEGTLDENIHLENLRNEFLDECNDRIENISKKLENIAENSGKFTNQIITIRRDVHSIKGMGGSFGYPVITAIAHRLEDFLIDRDAMDTHDVKNSYIFLDCIKLQLKRDTQASLGESADIVRSLPSKFILDDIVKSKRIVEALSIMPKSLQQRLINQEIRECGFRISNISSSIMAIDMAVHTRPDLIVISALIDEIDGTELAHIFRSISHTKILPIILVTSFEDIKLSDKALPSGVSIARKGKDFPDDLAKCLIELDVL